MYLDLYKKAIDEEPLKISKVGVIQLINQEKISSKPKTNHNEKRLN
jgi:hypothetical protein